MKYLFYIITGSAALTALWNIFLNPHVQSARVTFDTPVQALSTRRPHPQGSIPIAPATTATGTGAELFIAHCTHCHGSDGNGQSYVSRYAGMPAVGNLTTSERSPEEISQILHEGRGAMPAFGSRLRPSDLQELLLYITTHLRKQ